MRERLAEEGRVVAEKRPYLHSVGHSERSGEAIEPRLSHAVVGEGGNAGQGRGRRGSQRRYHDSPRRVSNRAGSAGSTTCTTGASRASCGGAIASRSGTAPTARCVASARTRPHPTAGCRTRTCSTPGSPRACGRSPRWAGRIDTAELDKFYPTSVLVTGYDILFFWVARMMMFGLYVSEDESVAAGKDGRAGAVHGCVPARPDSRPVRQEDVEVAWQRHRPARLGRSAYGADALRFTLARGAQPGSDLSIGESHALRRATSSPSCSTRPSSR